MFGAAAGVKFRRGLFALAVGLFASGTSPVLAESSGVGIYEAFRADVRSRQRFVPVERYVVPVFASSTVVRVQQPRRMTPRRVASAGGGATGVCVRLCDGYAFPVGPIVSASRAQASCEAGCPGAPVRLFTLRGSSDDLDQAVDAGGMTYRSLPSAYLHRTRLTPGCGCQNADNIATRVPLERDGTLRPGDVFVTATSALAVVGAVEARRFVDFRKAGSLTRSQRAQVDEKLGVTRREADAHKFRQAFVAQGGKIVVVAAPAPTPVVPQIAAGRAEPARGFAALRPTGGAFRVIR
jgi:hypothetical protein